MSRSIVLAAAAAVFAFAASAHAEQSAVSTKGLDLSVAADAKTFYAKLNRAVVDACGGAPTYFLGSEEDRFQACYKSTMADAVAKAHAPLVAALFNKTQPAVELASR